MSLKRFGLILATFAVVVLAGAAVAQVGHITPVGHVDNIELDWETVTSQDVVVNAPFRALYQEEAPDALDNLGTLQLPEDKTYTLTLLGGIEAGNLSNVEVTAQEGGIEPQVGWSIISGDFNLTGQNMVLLYNGETGKWDGLPGSHFEIPDDSSYALNDEDLGMRVRVIAAKATEVTSGGGGGGGCSVGFLAPAGLLFLAPLFLLRRRG